MGRIKGLARVVVYFGGFCLLVALMAVLVWVFGRLVLVGLVVYAVVEYTFRSIRDDRRCVKPLITLSVIIGTPCLIMYWASGMEGVWFVLRWAGGYLAVGFIVWVIVKYVVWFIRRIYKSREASLRKLEEQGYGRGRNADANGDARVQ